MAIIGVEVSCPECGGWLVGLNSNRLLRCTECGSVWTVRERKVELSKLREGKKKTADDGS